LAETLAELEDDIEHGRLAIKYILRHYDSRVEPALQKKRPQNMAEWCRFLGFKLLDGEEFRGVPRLTCLLFDVTVREFIDQRIRAPFSQEAPDTLEAVDKLASVIDAAREDFPARQKPFDDANIFFIPDDDDLQDDEDPHALPMESPAEATTPARQSPPGQEPEAMKGCADAGRTSFCPPVDAPCAVCRFFRPLPTFYGGRPGVRLCWSDGAAWDFSCFKGQPRA